MKLFLCLFLYPSALIAMDQLTIIQTDYYTYDGEYEDSYIIRDTLVVSDNNGLIVTYDEVGSGDFYVYYKITDIYGNEYYVEGIIF